MAGRKLLRKGENSMADTWMKRDKAKVYRESDGSLTIVYPDKREAKYRGRLTRQYE